MHCGPVLDFGPVAVNWSVFSCPSQIPPSCPSQIPPAGCEGRTLWSLALCRAHVGGAFLTVSVTHCPTLILRFTARHSVCVPSRSFVLTLWLARNGVLSCVTWHTNGENDIYFVRTSVSVDSEACASIPQAFMGMLCWASVHFGGLMA